MACAFSKVYPSRKKSERAGRLPGLFLLGVKTMYKKMLIILLIAVFAFNFIPEPPKAEAFAITSGMLITAAALLTAAGIYALSEIDMENVSRGLIKWLRGSATLFSYFTEYVATGNVKINAALASTIEDYKSEVVTTGFYYYEPSIMGSSYYTQSVYQGITYPSLIDTMVNLGYFDFDLDYIIHNMGVSGNPGRVSLRFKHYHDVTGSFVGTKTLRIYHSTVIPPLQIYDGTVSPANIYNLPYTYENLRRLYYSYTDKSWFFETSLGDTVALPFNGELESVSQRNYYSAFYMYGHVVPSSFVDGSAYDVDVNTKIDDYVGRTLSTDEVYVNGQAVPVTGVGSYVGANAVDIPVTAVDVGGVDVPAENIEIDLNPVEVGQIDWMPLIQSGENFKSKFPFSIPWDLRNAVQSLSAPAEVPRWEIPLDSWKLGANSLVIDFAQFETLAKIVRWGLLFLFIFGLALLSRYVIGG